MQNLNFLIKPASSQCNMRCRYCFYADEAAVRCGQSAAGMTRPEAETLIRSAFAAAEPGAQVSFSFQGGEPTLAGLDFFRFFMAKAAELRPDRVHINYALQTNGLVLNDEWAEFLAANGLRSGVRTCCGDLCYYDQGWRVHSIAAFVVVIRKWRG